MTLTLFRIGLAAATLACQSAPVRAQTLAEEPRSLQALNLAVTELTARVSPSVVQVLVTGYRMVGNSEGGTVIGRAKGSASGAIIDADGYIITNAHVVEGAEHIRVVLHAPPRDAAPLRALAGGTGVAIPATVVGIAKDIDLALLKIDRNGLTPLPLADYDTVRQGELVFAFGSPEGLRDSVSMGVISSTARQLDPDSSSVFIQTDAPINPGNSGGPLVNIHGELVGVNTQILSASGGSHGLGFAIPSAVVAAAARQLRAYGHPRRGSLGLQVQAISPALAEGLQLDRVTGVIISDVLPGSPADMAGVGVRDIILAVDGRTIDNVPLLTLAVATLQPGDRITLDLLRDTRTLQVGLVVGDRPLSVDRLSDLGDTLKGTVPALGIIGADLTPELGALLSGLRGTDGVLVTAHRQGAEIDSPLVAGDVIHRVNTHTVSSLSALQVLTEGLAPHSDVVLQIERHGQMRYVVVTAP
jgi:serine protease Do